MLIEAMSFQDAFTFVKKHRPVASPNTGFICSLLEWEKLLHETAAASTTALSPSKAVTRFFAILPHSEYDSSTLVAKCAMRESDRKIIPFDCKYLDSRTSFVILKHNEEEKTEQEREKKKMIVVWHGENSSNAAKEVALTFANDIATYLYKNSKNGEDAGCICIEHEEPSGKGAAATLSLAMEVDGSVNDDVKMEDVTPTTAAPAAVNDDDLIIPSYLPSFKLLDELLTRGSRGSRGSSMNNRGSASSPKGDRSRTSSGTPAPSLSQLVQIQQIKEGAVASYKWEKLGVYDSEDLLDEGIFLLNSGEDEGSVNFVWIGSSYSVDGAGGGEAVWKSVASFLKEHVEQSPEIHHFVLQNAEDDDFWDCFEDGSV
jgi:hypothetical protein